MSYRFNIGTQVTYRGQSQGGILAPGDLIEVVRLGSDPSYYIVKLAGSFTTHTWMVKDTDLEPTYSLPYEHSIYDAIDNSAGSSYDDLKIKRKENGECEACVKRLEMSFHGLLDCSCTPQLPARWQLQKLKQTKRSNKSLLRRLISMDWTVPCYLAWQELNHRLTPALAAPLARSGYTSCDQNISAPTPPTAQEEIQLPLPGFFFGINNDQPVPNSDVISTFVTISEPQKPAN